jgi:hypothetical protein
LAEAPRNLSLRQERTPCCELFVVIDCREPSSGLGEPLGRQTAARPARRVKRTQLDGLRRSICAAKFDHTMSDRIQHLLGEVRRHAERKYPGPLAEKFSGANERALESLQREIVGEIAYSLGKVGAKIERSLLVLERLLEKSGDAELTSVERLELEEVFRAERRTAELAIRDLIIQREALGFLHHEDVKSRYVLPRWIQRHC